jgi:hypothetical protein
MVTGNAALSWHQARPSDVQHGGSSETGERALFLVSSRAIEPTKLITAGIIIVLILLVRHHIFVYIWR